MSSTDFTEISIDTFCCFLIDVDDDHDVEEEIMMMMMMIIMIIMMMMKMIDDIDDDCDGDNRTYGFNQYLLRTRDHRSI